MLSPGPEWVWGAEVRDVEVRDVRCHLALPGCQCGAVGSQHEGMNTLEIVCEEFVSGCLRSQVGYGGLNTHLCCTQLSLALPLIISPGT